VPSLSSWFLELVAITAEDKQLLREEERRRGEREEGRGRIPQYDFTDLH